MDGHGYLSKIITRKLDKFNMFTNPIGVIDYCIFTMKCHSFVPSPVMGKHTYK